MRKLLAAAIAGAAAVAIAGLPSLASDHLDAPLVKNDGRTDINDVYVFESPEDSDNVVLAMTVNPGAGVISGTSFDQKATYVFDIDTNGDAVADDSIDVDFGRVHRNGRQRADARGPRPPRRRRRGRDAGGRHRARRHEWDDDDHDGWNHHGDGRGALTTTVGTTGGR